MDGRIEESRAGGLRFFQRGNRFPLTFAKGLFGLSFSDTSIAVALFGRCRCATISIAWGFLFCSETRNFLLSTLYAVWGRTISLLIARGICTDSVGLIGFSSCPNDKAFTWKRIDTKYIRNR